MRNLVKLWRWNWIWESKLALEIEKLALEYGVEIQYTKCKSDKIQKDNSQIWQNTRRPNTKVTKYKCDKIACGQNLVRQNPQTTKLSRTNSSEDKIPVKNSLIVNNLKRRWWVPFWVVDNQEILSYVEFFPMRILF